MVYEFIITNILFSEAERLLRGQIYNEFLQRVVHASSAGRLYHGGVQ